MTPSHEEFLRTEANAVVATIQPDGQPQLTPNWYLWDGKAFWISTLDWTVKVRNARRDPRVTLCIDSGERRGNYVQVFGTCELVEGDVREQTLALIRKYIPDETAAVAHWDSIAPDRVLMRIVPVRWQWRYE
jgi:PPOX class probable F420-dependent enzyme